MDSTAPAIVIAPPADVCAGPHPDGSFCFGNMTALHVVAGTTVTATRTLIAADAEDGSPYAIDAGATLRFDGGNREWWTDDDEGGRIRWFTTAALTDLAWECSDAGLLRQLGGTSCVEIAEFALGIDVDAADVEPEPAGRRWCPSLADEILALSWKTWPMTLDKRAVNEMVDEDRRRFGLRRHCSAKVAHACRKAA